MTTINNFDATTQPVKLELFIERDNDSSQNDFAECFVRDYHLPHVWHYVDYGNVGTGSVIDLDNWKTNREDLITAFKERGWFEECYELYGYAPSKLTKTAMLDYLELLSDVDLLEFLKENFESNFYLSEIRGYNPGEHFTFVIPKSLLAECKTTTETNWDNMARNMCFNAPIYCRLDVGDEEIYLDQGLSDWYEWDKEQVLEYAREHISSDNIVYIMSWLESNLPDYV